AKRTDHAAHNFLCCAKVSSLRIASQNPNQKDAAVRVKGCRGVRYKKMPTVTQGLADVLQRYLSERDIKSCQRAPESCNPGQQNSSRLQPKRKQIVAGSMDKYENQKCR